MQVLDQAVEAIRKRGGNGAQVAAKLEAIAACGDQAARLWQGYLDSPGTPGDKYTIVSWIGAERAKQLYVLSLQAHELVKDVCTAAGKQARFLVLDESPIALAYRGLQEGETGPQAAQALLAEQQATNKHLRALADKVRTVKLAAKETKKTAVKKAVVRKKAAPKKKVAVRKPAAKKAVKKSPKKK
jgi:hypothetical protein